MNHLCQFDKVVLLGYSAGSFVTYQYYMTKSNSIDLASLGFKKLPNEIENFVAQNLKPKYIGVLFE